MTNSEMFYKIFGIHAGEFWSYQGEEMCDWLFRDAPERNVGDSISRQAAINIAKELHMSVDGYHQYNQAINNYCVELMKLPSAEPEIIRCKDCKNFRRWIDTDTTFCDFTDGIICKDDFCSRAERRTDE